MLIAEFFQHALLYHPELPGLFRQRRDFPEAACHPLREQWFVRNLIQIFGDVKNVPFRSHPLLPVEAGEINRRGKAAERFLAAEIEVVLEIRERELAERAVDGLAERETGIFRLAYRAPAAVLPEYRQDMVVVADRGEVDQQGMEAVEAQRSGGEDRSFYAVRLSLPDCIG